MTMCITTKAVSSYVKLCVYLHPPTELRYQVCASLLKICLCVGSVAGLYTIIFYSVTQLFSVWVTLFVLSWSTCQVRKRDFPPSLNSTLSSPFVAYRTPCLCCGWFHVWALFMCVFGEWEACSSVRLSGCVCFINLKMINNMNLTQKKPVWYLAS